MLINICFYLPRGSDARCDGGIKGVEDNDWDMGMGGANIPDGGKGADTVGWAKGNEGGIIGRLKGGILPELLLVGLVTGL